MLVLITGTSAEGNRAAARLVGQAIKKNPTLRLGLAAGNTPIGMYRNLVDLHRSEYLDFSHVRIFSLDEFHGLPTNSPYSYHAFFHHHLLDHINADPTHLHLLNGKADQDLSAYCATYERLIRDLGGIDLQVLGIGRNGHLGFNEPGSSLDSRTRISPLTPESRGTLARAFGQTQVPELAVTMGLGTIREARALLLLAYGKHKAEAVAKAVEGPLSVSTPASIVQLHPTAILVLDRAAASSLTNQMDYHQNASEMANVLPDWLR